MKKTLGFTVGQVLIILFHVLVIHVAGKQAAPNKASDKANAYAAGYDYN